MTTQNNESSFDIVVNALTNGHLTEYASTWPKLDNGSLTLRQVAVLYKSESWQDFKIADAVYARAWGAAFKIAGVFLLLFCLGLTFADLRVNSLNHSAFIFDVLGSLIASGLGAAIVASISAAKSKRYIRARMVTNSPFAWHQQHLSHFVEAVESVRCLLDLTLEAFIEMHRQEVVERADAMLLGDATEIANIEVLQRIDRLSNEGYRHLEASMAAPRQRLGERFAIFAKLALAKNGYSDYFRRAREAMDAEPLSA